MPMCFFILGEYLSFSMGLQEMKALHEDNIRHIICANTCGHD